MKTPFRSSNSVRAKIDFRLIVGILGGFTLYTGLALLVPIPISLFYGDNSWHAFLISALIAIAIGGGLFLRFRPRDEVRSREAFFIVAITWVVLSVFSAAPFLLSGSLHSITDAFFETMSGLTTTGATVFGGTTTVGIENASIELLPESILFWRSFLHWIGGMGFIVLSIAILPFVGLGTTNLFQAESSVLENDKFTPRVQETAKLLWVVYFVFTALHFLLLWIHPKMDWFDALNHAMSTMATGGFSTKDSSVGFYDSAYIDYVIVVFMYLAGISFAMHFRLMRGEHALFFKNRETIFYTKVSVIAIVLISGSLWLQGNYSISDALRYGSFQAMSIITTTGYATDDYGMWPSLALVAILMLFFTGACAGSTAGGIKMFRHMILIRAIGREIRQSVHPRAVLPLKVGNRIVEPPMVRKVLSFLMLYIILFLVGALSLTAMGVDAVSALSASIASLGSVGPALGEFGPSSNYAGMPEVGKWLMSLLMLIGRLELFTVMVLFSLPFWRE
jgi:trk system potassium uptake protein